MKTTMNYTMDAEQLQKGILHFEQLLARANYRWASFLTSQRLEVATTRGKNGLTEQMQKYALVTPPWQFFQEIISDYQMQLKELED